MKRKEVEKYLSDETRDSEGRREEREDATYRSDRTAALHLTGVRRERRSARLETKTRRLENPLVVLANEHSVEDQDLY